MKNKVSILLAAFVIACVAASCDRQSGYLPKPRGYFRIDLPEKAYTKVDTIERYSFECPQYAQVTPDPYSPDEKNWVNIEMPDFKGSIHLTHKPVNGNLGEYLARPLVRGIQRYHLVYVTIINIRIGHIFMRSHAAHAVRDEDVAGGNGAIGIGNGIQPTIAQRVLPSGPHFLGFLKK